MASPLGKEGTCFQLGEVSYWLRPWAAKCSCLRNGDLRVFSGHSPSCAGCNLKLLLSAVSQEVQGTLLSLSIYACEPTSVFRSGTWELVRCTGLFLYLSAVRSSWGLLGLPHTQCPGKRSQFAGSGRRTQLLECCPLCSWKPARHFSSEPLWSFAGTGLDQNYLFSAGCLQFSLQEASPGGRKVPCPGWSLSWSFLVPTLWDLTSLLPITTQN